MGKRKNSGNIPKGKVLHTRYGRLDMADRKTNARIRKAVVELQRTTDALIRRDLRDWRIAWQRAINVDSPDRRALYDIYRDVSVDLHLSGCIGQREGFVKARTFKITGPDGRDDEKALAYFDAKWFKDLIEYAMESIYWGHSLIELGDVIRDGNGARAFDGVKLIPRKHVIPEFGVVISDLGQDHTTGIPYRQPPFTDWLIEVGKPDNLGLFLKAATQTIPKKNALSFWDTFAEIFGMPLRIARTTTRDPEERRKMERMMDEMGTAGWGIFQEGTEIEVVESTKGDSFNVYDRRIERANSELSKLLIGQTMTIEDGSSLSQSQTHLKVFENLIESDCDMIRDVVNDQLIPRMIRLGFPLEGRCFDWDYSVDYTPEQQVQYETMIADRYEVEGTYFAEKYGLPVGKPKQRQSLLPNKEDNSKPFFD